MTQSNKFIDYISNSEKYITFVENDFYPDYLTEAADIYREPLSFFRKLVFNSTNSSNLLENIAEIKDQKLRTQILRIFRKYVSPDTSVEMLKRKSKIPEIISEFSYKFRDLEKIKEIIYGENEIDPVLVALLYEYKDRGKKGYELTEKFFRWFEQKFSTDYQIDGPVRAGKDINLCDVLDKYDKKTPADFIITDKVSREIIAVGFARYDSDRGGAQEDDRTSGNRDKITLIKEYNKKMNRQIKVIFLNDGPGLLLGSMWKDYSDIEEYGDGLAIVCTLKMLEERLSKEWLNQNSL
ncbi:TPA: hypothetical protein U0634_002077 [Streptococcus suis]|nr:hypothetical protein [Streptococcus suis]HEM2814276.1 hypothetical protein [Streptococcus suis]